MTEDKSRGERRAETARENDDSDLIEDAEALPGQQGRSGGNLQRDVGSQAEQRRVRDPEAHESKTKSDGMNHGQFTPEPGSATEVVGERED
jgi:hypothetical protein